MFDRAAGHKRLDAQLLQLTLRMLTHLGGHHCPAPGKGISYTSQQMPAQRMFRIETAVPLNLSLINQLGLAVFHIIDQKPFRVSEVLINLFSVL